VPLSAVHPFESGLPWSSQENLADACLLQSKCSRLRFRGPWSLVCTRGMREPFHRVTADAAVAFRDVRPLDILSEVEKNTLGTLVCRSPAPLRRLHGMLDLCRSCSCAPSFSVFLDQGFCGAGNSALGSPLGTVSAGSGRLSPEGTPGQDWPPNNYLAAMGVPISVPITSPEITSSTRRFCCRPSAVSLEATG
jgi:hypothetical protein